MHCVNVPIVRRDDRFESNQTWSPSQPSNSFDCHCSIIPLVSAVGCRRRFRCILITLQEKKQFTLPSTCGLLNLKTNSFAHTQSVYYRERILVRHILSATCLPIINRDFLAIKEQFPFRGEIRTEQRRKANFLLESFELGTAWHVGPHGEGHHRCDQPTSDLQGVRTRVDSLVCASAHSGLTEVT